MSIILITALKIKIIIIIINILKKLIIIKSLFSIKLEEPSLLKNNKKT